MMILILLVYLLWTFVPFASTGCLWPSTLQNSYWWDSNKGELYLTASSLTGLSYNISRVHVNSWDCLYQYEVDGVFILRSSSIVPLLGTDFRLFLCLNISAVTNYSYSYYINTAKETNLNDERLTIKKETDVGTITESTARSELCTAVDVTTVEYRVLVKKGFEQKAVQECPKEYQDNFFYSVQDGGVSFCGTGNETWTVGPELNTMSFNYTSCTIPVAYSDSGSVQCMTSITQANTTVTTVMSQATPSYMFACLMSTELNNGSLLVSQSRGSCVHDQTAAVQPVQPDGSLGLLFTLTPHQTIDITTPAPTSSFTTIPSTLTVVSANNSQTTNTVASVSFTIPNDSSTQTGTTEPTSTNTLISATSITVATIFRNISSSSSAGQFSSDAPTVTEKWSDTTTTKGSLLATSTDITKPNNPVTQPQDITLIENNINTSGSDILPYAIVICVLAFVVLVLLFVVGVLAYKINSKSQSVIPVHWSAAEERKYSNDNLPSCSTTPRYDNLASCSATSGPNVAVCNCKIVKTQTVVSVQDVTNNFQKDNTRINQETSDILEHVNVNSPNTTNFKHKHANVKVISEYPPLTSKAQQYHKSILPPITSRSESMPTSLAEIGSEKIQHACLKSKQHVKDPTKYVTHSKPNEHSESRLQMLQIDEEEHGNIWRDHTDSPCLIQITHDKHMGGTTSSLCIISSAR